MKVGIPKAFLYYRYRTLWETFFDALNIEVVLSPDTNKEILNRGTMYAIDETCLSSKIYLGHVDYLLDKCDRLFVPRISNFGKDGILCTKFEALYDIVRNTFRDQSPKLLDFNIDIRRSKGELAAFLHLGSKLGKGRAATLRAYTLAKMTERQAAAEEVRTQNLQLNSEGLKILIVGHPYNVYDKLIGGPVLKILSELGTTPIIADVVDRRRARERCFEITESLPWMYNRELVGAVREYTDKVHGIVLLSAFPCGPDSLVNEILLRRVRGIPMLNLLMDSQQAEAGIETRLESFIDIIRFKQEAIANEA
jgi:predicted nucleotide-binding protein (sugar kinase/HSP70/actin superfamily)